MFALRMTALSRCLLFLLLFALAACSGKRPPRDTAAPGAESGQGTVVSTGARRADPGYLQYLERLSMLGNQTELARVVSGSQLAWMKPGDTPFPDPLLGLADTWLAINPLTMLPEGKKSVFATLASPQSWQVIGRAKVGGVYLSPVNGAGGLWAYNRKASSKGDDVIQYSFSESAGTEEEYFRLLSSANTNKKLLGLDLTPATTGMGPDFFLAARFHRQYTGLYCMIEVPPQLWPALPPVSDQWRGEALSDGQTAELTQQGFLPKALVQDYFPGSQGNSQASGQTNARAGGWAATGEIHGVDGAARRWVYRFHGSPDRPVLNWEDPSATARRVLSGSAIRSVGMLGGALVGMRLEGLYGLDAAPAMPQKRFNPAPADGAAVALSREVRRYGGWSWLVDEIPLSQVAALMPKGPDFFLDHIFSPAVEHALLTGSTQLLEHLTDDALILGLDMRRFVHATAGERGVSYVLPHLSDVASGGTVSSISRKQAAELRTNVLAEAQNAVYASNLGSKLGQDLPPLKDRHLNTTPAGVAALALGAGNADSVTPDMMERVRDGNLLQIFFRAMLPGLLLISGQDIAGSLPLSWYAMADSSAGWDVALASRGAYSFSRSLQDTAVTAQGVPRAKTIYPPADVQIHEENAFITMLGDILAIRTKLGIAAGSLHGRFVTMAPSCFAMAVILPGPGGQTRADGPSPATLRQRPDIPKEEAWLVTPDADRRMPAAERRKLEFEANEKRRADLEQRIIAAPDDVRGGNIPAPGNSAVITVVNFSHETIREVLNLSHDPTLKRIREKGAPMLLTRGRKEGDIRISHGPNTVTFTLAPWQCAAVLIGERPE